MMMTVFMIFRVGLGEHEEKENYVVVLLLIWVRKEKRNVKLIERKNIYL